MEMQSYNLRENTTQEELKDMVINIFSQTKYIYFMIPDFYSELKNELHDKYVSLFGDKEFTIGYILDNELDYLYEFFERGISLPFVITNKIITDCIFETAASYNYDTFYSLFEENNISHIKLGADSETLIYMKY